jgi:hypothetical protein
MSYFYSLEKAAFVVQNPRMNCFVVGCCLVVVEEVEVCCHIAHFEAGNDFDSNPGADGLL